MTRGSSHVTRTGTRRGTGTVWHGDTATFWGAIEQLGKAKKNSTGVGLSSNPPPKCCTKLAIRINSGSEQLAATPPPRGGGGGI